MDTLITGIGPGKVGSKGGFNSEDYNAFQEKVLAFFASIAEQWNTILQPLIDSLPEGGRVIATSDRSEDIDPITNGFDGSQIYMDLTSTEQSDEGLLYDSTVGRPLTIKETSLAFRTNFLNEVARLDGIIAKFDASGILTEAQKRRIGYNVFDPTKSSVPDSIDGRAFRNSLHLTEFVANVFNLGRAVGDPLQIPVAGIGLQSIVPTINDRLTQTETDISDLWSNVWPQTQVFSSGTVNDNFAGPTNTLENDLNQIRTVIKNTKGSTTWLQLPSVIFTPGGVQWVDLRTHINTAGTGIQDAQNPHGLDFVDLDDTTGLIAGFATQLLAIWNLSTCALQRIGSPDPDTPPCQMSYATTHFIQATTTLREADMGLDTAIWQVEQDYLAADADLQDQINAVSGFNRIFNCELLEAPDGSRVVFHLAVPISGEAIPDSGGYDWPGNTLLVFQLEFDPVEHTGVFFTSTGLSGIFQSEVYGTTPSYPGEFLIVYDHSDIFMSGMEVGEVYVYTPPGTWDDTARGCVSYWTALIGDYREDSLEVSLSRDVGGFDLVMAGIRFRDWDEYPPCASGPKNRVSFTTAPQTNDRTIIHLTGV